MIKLFTNKKIFWTIVIIFILFICCAYCGLLYWNQNRVILVDETTWSNNADLDTSVDSYKDTVERINIRGWCILKGEAESSANYDIVVHNIENNKYYKVNTGYVRRDDVTAYFADGNDYGNSGFFANISKKKLPKGNYEIGILYRINNQNIYNSLNETFEVK